MSKKNIVDALEGISDAISGGGSSGGGGGSSSGGFTNVYYNTEEDLLMCYKNGEYVPFTLMDLTEDTEVGGLKTIPVLIYSDSVYTAFSVPKLITVWPDGIYLTFAVSNLVTVKFVAKEANDYQFTIDIDSIGSDTPMT